MQGLSVLHSYSIGAIISDWLGFTSLKVFKMHFASLFFFSFVCDKMTTSLAFREEKRVALCHPLRGLFSSYCLLLGNHYGKLWDMDAHQ